MNKHMRVVTKETQGYEHIPDGYACIYMDNHGWVGTGDGNIMGSQPALFPIAQALALMYAWGHVLHVGAKLFDRSTPRCEVDEFDGLALFPFDYDDQVLGWLSPTSQMV